MSEVQGVEDEVHQPLAPLARLDGHGHLAPLQVWFAQRDRLLVPPGPNPSREQLLIIERFQEELEREQAAIASLLEQESDVIDLVQDGSRQHAAAGVVVAHRHDWMRIRLRELLPAEQLHVLAAVGDTAHVIAAAVVYQPAVLVMSDLLPGAFTGLEILTRVLELSPATRAVVQVDAEARVPSATAAGATTVLSHRATVAQLVQAVSQAGRP